MSLPWLKDEIAGSRGPGGPGPEGAGASAFGLPPVSGRLGSAPRSVCATGLAAVPGFGSLPPGFAEPPADPVRPPRSRLPAISREAAIDALVGMTLAEVEAALVEATIAARNGSVPAAAKVLGVSPSTLYRRRAERSVPD